MKIDAHQHFWQYSPQEYPWINTEMKVIQKDFGPEDLWQEQKSVEFSGSIAVQARESLQETKDLLHMAESDSRIKGVVGWANLLDEQIEQTLSELSQYPKLSGLRMILQAEEPAYILQPAFRRGIGYLHHFGFTYDLLLFPKHLPNAIQLVEEFPDQPFVLDHISKPFIKAGILTPWQNDIQTLASYPHVHCKLSGMVTEAAWNQWKPDDFRPYLDTVWEAFGEDRLMIGSDWPVCLVSGTYSETMQLVMSYLESFSEETQRKVLGENCLRFYQRST